MRFRIPQFLDIEDKIFGPFTLKQFGYSLGAVAFAYIFWKLIPWKIVSLPFILVFSGTSFALAFVKINNRPFADILESAYKFILNNKTYIWQKKEDSSAYTLKEEMSALDIIKKMNTPVVENKINMNDKIKELSGRLDILDDKKKASINIRQELIKKNVKYKI